MKVHFLGLGGAGLSALAGWMVDESNQVSGCDVDINVRIEPLLKKGVQFEKGNNSSHISDDLDWLIHPNIDQSHPEIQAAKDKGIKTSTYFQALGEVTKDYFTIAIAGAHGKTTTTSMIEKIFKDTGNDINAIIGEGVYKYGRQEVFLVEACEYKKQFLSLKPNLLVITNIAYDHPDSYQSKEEVVQVFKELISQMKPNGLIIGYCHDQEVIKLLRFGESRGLRTKIYGEELVSYQPRGWGSISKINFDGADYELVLNLPGKHNVYNALAALEVGFYQGIKIEKAVKSLAGYSGCRLRLEKIGKIGQTKFVLDYGHHPDQIEAVLSSLTDAYPKKKIAVVFEPHQYERTWQLFERFGTCWTGVDKIYLLPIYKVKGRESEQALSQVSSWKLKQRIENEKVKIDLFKGKEDMWDKLTQEVASFDLVIVFAAGPLSNFIRQKFND